MPLTENTVKPDSYKQEEKLSLPKKLLPKNTDNTPNTPRLDSSQTLDKNLPRKNTEPKNTVQTRISEWRTRASNQAAAGPSKVGIIVDKKRKHSPDSPDKKSVELDKSKRVKHLDICGGEEQITGREVLISEHAGFIFKSKDLNPTYSSKLGEMGPGQDQLGDGQHQHLQGGEGGRDAEGGGRLSPQEVNACARKSIFKRSEIIFKKTETDTGAGIGRPAESDAAITNSSTAYRRLCKIGTNETPRYL